MNFSFQWLKLYLLEKPLVILSEESKQTVILDVFFLYKAACASGKGSHVIINNDYLSLESVLFRLYEIVENKYVWFYNLKQYIPFIQKSRECLSKANTQTDISQGKLTSILCSLWLGFLVIKTNELPPLTSDLPSHN